VPPSSPPAHCTVTRPAHTQLSAPRPQCLPASRRIAFRTPTTTAAQPVPCAALGLRPTPHSAPPGSRSRPRLSAAPATSGASAACFSNRAHPSLARGCPMSPQQPCPSPLAYVPPVDTSRSGARKLRAFYRWPSPLTNAAPTARVASGRPSGRRWLFRTAPAACVLLAEGSALNPFASIALRASSPRPMHPCRVRLRLTPSPRSAPPRDSSHSYSQPVARGGVLNSPPASQEPKDTAPGGNISPSPPATVGLNCVVYPAIKRTRLPVAAQTAGKSQSSILRQCEPRVPDQPPQVMANTRPLARAGTCQNTPAKTTL
jgi:hypothetical protein